MNATNQLPGNYHEHLSINLMTQNRLLLALNFVALILFVISGWLLIVVVKTIRPNLLFNQSHAVTFTSVLWVLVTYALVILLHELIHGLVFWLVTRHRPSFGFKVVYAYAAAPEWYIPRNPYLLIGLAPLLVITLVGLILIPFIQANMLLLLWFAITANASGAVGDLYVVWTVLRLPANTLVQDCGDSFSIYLSG